MITSHFRKRWNEIQASPEPAVLKELADQIAQVFLDRHFYKD